MAAEVARQATAAAPPSPWMNYAEAAEYLRAKPQRVRDLVYQGRLSRHAEGGRPLVPRAEVEALVRAEKAPATLTPC